LKKAVTIICVLLFCSCNYFESKKIHATDESIQNRLETLDKSVIDKFPVFKDCEQVDENVAAEKNCFITSLSNYITNSLLEKNLVLEKELDSYFQVLIEVSKEGNIEILSFTIDDILKESIPDIEQIIAQSIAELPNITPAYKKINSGEHVKVKTQFIIPIRVVAQIEGD